MNTAVSKDSEFKLNGQTILFVGGIIALLFVAIWMIGSQLRGRSSETSYLQAQAKFEEETGIRILRIVTTAGGGMVDLQYQVIDPDKALAVHDDDNPPTLIDVRSDVILATPFHEHGFRELKTAVTYHELIMNAGGILKSGSTVTLTVGDSRLDGLKVQ